jgi:hypothetical protein
MPGRRISLGESLKLNNSPTHLNHQCELILNKIRTPVIPQAGTSLDSASGLAKPYYICQPGTHTERKRKGKRKGKGNRKKERKKRKKKREGKRKGKRKGLRRIREAGAGPMTDVVDTVANDAILPSNDSPHRRNRSDPRTNMNKSKPIFYDVYGKAGQPERVLHPAMTAIPSIVDEVGEAGAPERVLHPAMTGAPSDVANGKAGQPERVLHPAMTAIPSVGGKVHGKAGQPERVLHPAMTAIPSAGAKVVETNEPPVRSNVANARVPRDLADDYEARR